MPTERPVVVRDQMPTDAAAVADVLGSAFVTEPEVVALDVALGLRPDSTGFVAVDGDVVVGHVRLTRAWIDAEDRLVDVLVLSPLGVRPDRQGRGIGAALVARAVAAAAEQGAPAVFLEGDPGYYGRLGWRPASEFGVTAPSVRIPAPALQGVVLPGHDASMRGRLVYPETFWQHDAVGLRGRVLAQAAAALDQGADPSAGEAVAGELALLDPTVRADPERVAGLLAADFVEFGASGRVWERAEIVGSLAGDPGSSRQVEHLSTTALGSDAVLVTYALVGDPGSWRSSVWVRDVDGRWRLRFHQGTSRATVTDTPSDDGTMAIADDQT